MMRVKHLAEAGDIVGKTPKRRKLFTYIWRQMRTTGTSQIAMIGNGILDAFSYYFPFLELIKQRSPLILNIVNLVTMSDKL